MESRLAAPSSVAPIARNKRAIRSCATALEARQEDHQDLFQRQFGGYFLGRKAAQKRQPDNNLFQSACKPPGLLLDTRHRTEQSPKWPSRSLPVLAAPVAQLDRASDYGSGGWEFESSRARQKPHENQRLSPQMERCRHGAFFYVGTVSAK